MAYNGPNRRRGGLTIRASRGQTSSAFVDDDFSDEASTYDDEAPSQYTPNFRYPPQRQSGHPNYYNQPISGPYVYGQPQPPQLEPQHRVQFYPPPCVRCHTMHQGDTCPLAPPPQPPSTYTQESEVTSPPSHISQTFHVSGSLTVINGAPNPRANYTSTGTDAPLRPIDYKDVGTDVPSFAENEEMTSAAKPAEMNKGKKRASQIQAKDGGASRDDVEDRGSKGVETPGC